MIRFDLTLTESTLSKTVSLLFGLMFTNRGTKEFTLQEIYDLVRPVWPFSRRSMESSIRAQIERHSSSSAAFQGNVDVFRRSGRGRWHIRPSHVQDLLGYAKSV